MAVVLHRAQDLVFIATTAKGPLTRFLLEAELNGVKVVQFHHSTAVFINDKKVRGAKEDFVEVKGNEVNVAMAKPITSCGVTVREWNFSTHGLKKPKC